MGRAAGSLPRGAERDGPLVAAVDAEGLVPALESTIAHPPQDDILAEAQDREVDMAIAIDVDRVGAGHRPQIRRGVRDALEAQRAGDPARVPEQRGRRVAAGEEQIGHPVGIAVERGHAATHDERELPGVGVADPGAERVIDEPRRAERCRGRAHGRRTQDPRGRHAADVEQGHGHGHGQPDATTVWSWAR